MKLLEPGMQAPPFKVTAVDGRIVDLTGQTRQKYWLMFYRYATCPLCSHHAATVRQEYSHLKGRGLEVVAIYESELDKFPLNARTPGSSPFPLVSDPQKEIYKIYRVGKSLGAVLHPSVLGSWTKAVTAGHRQGLPDGELAQRTAHFLILPNGILHSAYYGKTIDDHIPWGRVKHFVNMP